jgi:hypothetical protein
MYVSGFGRVVVVEWGRTAHPENVGLDAFVVMPDHIHGIICITSGGYTDARRVTAAP